jgi:hypothetical protein
MNSFARCDLVARSSDCAKALGAHKIVITASRRIAEAFLCQAIIRSIIRSSFAGCAKAKKERKPFSLRSEDPSPR